MITHEIKILPEFYDQILKGYKQFELRKNDRNYQTGDIVIFREWDGKQYTGREVVREIGYVLKNCPQYGLMDGYCIFGCSKLKAVE